MNDIINFQDECASNPCLNDGQCRDQVNGFLCNCTDTGFEGDTCENNVDDCQGVTCEHGGSCVDFLKDYNCTCQPGYEGKNCENDIDECEASPCKNGGECYQKSNETLYNLVCR
jgi:protein crumbs